MQIQTMTQIQTGYTKVCNHPQPPITIYNHLQQSATTHSQPQPPKNHPQQPTTNHNDPKNHRHHSKITPKKPKLVTNSYVTAL